MKPFILQICAICCWLFSTGATSAELNKYQIDVWADNWFAAYIDGELLLEDSVSITTERSFNAETLQFSSSFPFVLAFIIKDFKENDTGLEYIGSRRQQIGDGGFITQVTDLDSGNVVGVSSAAMHCKVIHKAPLDSNCASESDPIAGEGQCQFMTAEEPVSWKTPAFDDSSWQHATEYTAAQVGPKEGYDKIRWASAAKLIWSEDLKKDNTLLCRLVIDGKSDMAATQSEAVLSQSEHSHNEIHAYFAHFDNVKTSEDSTYVKIESNGMPEHKMMEGITSWQQQVPLPQDYTGSNSWKIPLKPVLADNPMLTKEHFHKGAIAIAVNGVPIFNALNNRGVYSADVGELDAWGGHSGKADDYHYHLAPEHLEAIVGEGNPIAYALDGFPLYGKTEAPLDEYLGRFNQDGTYEYHAVAYPPYLIAGLRGEVQVDSLLNAPEDQIVPQPRSYPVRHGDYGPLRGAKITGLNKIAETGYALEYTLNGKQYQLNYSWNEDLQYQFVFVDENGNQTIERYQRKEQ
ncbi:YHYH protein [Neptunomonas antarctica]|uniref:YHYH protein n=1 Tax=Neptunomonas antarctica TaxID=619304 RepID=A0A1N7M389_9GAMM|nr:YHYH protein [Neptunomonas antarctica]SIS80585.1 YHYH protein [Neptunomonas antarctica]